MLVLSRKPNESLVIGDNIEVIVLEVRDGNVKLGINAPKEVSVHRNEVYEEIKKSKTSNSKQVNKC